jgi:hypothetical protein
MRASLAFFALSSSAASGCTTEFLTVVSQHVKGTGVTKQHLEEEGQPATDMVVKMNISSSFDVDSLNMVQSVEASTHVNDQSISLTMHQILNWEEGAITVHTSQPGQDPKCQVMKLPTFLNGERFKRVMALTMNSLKKTYKCKGTANGIDTYTLDLAPPAWLPVQFPVEFHTTIDVDKDFLVHKETVKENINMNGMKSHSESTFVFDETSAGGPTADDMAVPNSWGACEGERELDVEEMLKPSGDGSMHAVGEFRKILQALRFLELAKHSEIVV